MIEQKIQVVKLNNGDDLIANVSPSGLDAYNLDEPMLFGIDFRGHEGQLVMKHYLPVQLLKSNSLTIKSKDILSFLEPDGEFAEYYNTTVSKMRHLLNARDSLEEPEAGLDELMLEAFQDLEVNGKPIH